MNQFDDVLKKREDDSHKGDYGRLLVIAGNEEMTGACQMTALAAFRTGAGLVYLCVPKSTYAIFQTNIMEAICLDRSKDIDYGQFDTIAIGPGLGKGDDAVKLVTDVLNSFTGKLVIDADGINAISMNGLYDEVRNSKADIVITPHEGEASRIIPRDDMDRTSWAKAISEKLGCITVLKGHRTVITDGEEVYINETGNPGMAVAGSGDVLTGVISSFLAQGADVFKGAAAGSYVHGLAGDIAKETTGIRGLMPRDIIGCLPEAVIKTLGE